MPRYKMTGRHVCLLGVAVITVGTGSLLKDVFTAPLPRHQGKSVSLWCDQLPVTVPFPLNPHGFARMTRNTSSLTEQFQLQDQERAGLLAIQALGTNCMPYLLSRLCEKHSPLQLKWRNAAAKWG